MSVLTSTQINTIWASKQSLLGYVYVCEDGNLYKGVSGGTLQRVLNANYDTWLAQKKLNANDGTPTSNSTITSQSTNTNNQFPTVVTNVVEEDNSDTSVLTYDNDGNLIKKVLSLNGSVTETKTFEYDADGGLTKLIKSDGNGTEVKDFNFNSNGDLTSIDIT
jgi:hypothetical protein